MNDYKEILNRLPYIRPFLFVDEIEKLDEHGCSGKYHLRKDLDFYKGHFRENPVTPGVILTEIMAQIGLVCLGIYLLGETNDLKVALTETNIAFLSPVFPEETVTVLSEKIYFRFGKLKCKVSLYRRNGDLACEGTIAGMIINKKNGE